MSRFFRLTLPPFLLGLVVALVFVRPWRGETADPRLLVVESLEEILQLGTVEMTLSEVRRHRDVERVLGVIPTEKNALLRVTGRVKAGFDLSAGEFSIDVSEEGHRVTVSLPPAEILSIDPVVEILDEEGGWMNPVTLEDRNRWYRWARGDLRRAALDAGILDAAERRMEKLLRTFGAVEGAEIKLVGRPVLESESPTSISR